MFIQKNCAISFDYYLHVGNGDVKTTYIIELIAQRMQMDKNLFNCACVFVFIIMNVFFIELPRVC